MAERKRPADVTQFEVLYSSARRCCVCFALNRDYSEKKGQIAHLDRDYSNNSLNNLAWLCLEHHDAYDTRTSQSKGFSESEVRRYRQLLYDEVVKRRAPDAGDDAAAEKILKNKLIKDNIGLFFFAALHMYDSPFRTVLLNEVQDPQFREEIQNAWQWLDSLDTQEKLEKKGLVATQTRLHQMTKYVASCDEGREDFQTLLALAGCEVCSMDETRRNETLFAVHSDTVRSGLMLVRKIHLNNLRNAVAGQQRGEVNGNNISANKPIDSDEQ